MHARTHITHAHTHNVYVISSTFNIYVHAHSAFISCILLLIFGRSCTNTLLSLSRFLACRQFLCKTHRRCLQYLHWFRLPRSVIRHNNNNNKKQQQHQDNKKKKQWKKKTTSRFSWRALREHIVIGFLMCANNFDPLHPFSLLHIFALDIRHFFMYAAWIKSSTFWFHFCKDNTAAQ